LIRDPGPPRSDRVRYRAFQQIQIAFNDAYDPAPSTFPATLVTVEGSDALHRCGELMPELDVRVIGGDHNTMLLPPHIDEIAEIVAAAADNRFASGRRLG
jgi:hypothetical protein